MRALLAVLLLLAGTAFADESSRFFVAGDGTLTMIRVAGNEKATVRYRLADGTYDPEALARLRRILRSKDGKQGEVTPRFVELLGWMYVRTGKQPLRLMSGYRSPSYNEGLRRAGRKAASGSLHTEGMAADLMLPKATMRDLWLDVRALECCGAGYYAGNGFMHVDTGTPRFWEAATSRTDENLSGGNARLFARTEFDRYQAGDPIEVSLHAITLPPVQIARTATLIPDGGTDGARVTVDDAHAPGGDGCIEVDALTRLRVTGAIATPRARIVLATCEPRVERTPAQVQTNPIAIR